MKVRRVFLLVIFCLLISTLPMLARALQATSPLVAFVNSSGQLIVSSGDGSYRWIVTNPGETLAGGYTWSQAGDQLFFAVNANNSLSLRAANVSQQAASEIGQGAGEVLTVSPDGKFTFEQQANGSYSVQALNGGNAATLALNNDVGTHNSGLWSDASPFVAYWGYAGTSNLAVTDAANGQTATIDSGLNAPVLPLAWVSGSAQLIYRDADGHIRLADFSCLQSGCNGTADLKIKTLASADADIAVDSTSLYFRSGNSISAVNLNCANSNNCANSAVVIAGDAAPQTALNAAGNTLVYTAYEQNPNDPNDREVRTLDLGCVSNLSSCTPKTVLTSASAGAISADGQFAVVEQASGLSTLDLSSGTTAYLADKGAPLSGAVWQP